MATLQTARCTSTNRGPTWTFGGADRFGMQRSIMDVLPLRTADSPAGKTNFAGFDALRAGAALGVVLLHSCVPYLQHPMPGLAWSVRDTASSIVDFGFWWIELFIMPLFLVIAGFLAWRTLQRRGPVELVKSRAKRLLTPLLFGVLVVLPLDLYCWVLGWVAEGLVAPIKLKSLKFDGVIDRDLWGLSHLWFLQYLFLYVVAVAIAMFAHQRFEFLKRLRLNLPALTSVVLLAGSLTLYVRPEVVWGFQHAFLPIPSKWFYSGLFFAFGAALAAHDGQLAWLKRRSQRLFVPAIVLSVAAVLLGRWYLASDGSQQLAKITLAALTCASGLLVTSALIGVAVSRINRVPQGIHYLAAASFWIYLVHHPILGLVQLDLKLLVPGSYPVAKTAAAFLIASGFSLLSYEGLVRRTELGRWLGFSWEAPSKRDQYESILSIDSLQSRAFLRGRSDPQGRLIGRLPWPSRNRPQEFAPCPPLPMPLVSFPLLR